MHIQHHQPTLDPTVATTVRVAIITAQFNREYTSSLERHCVAALQQAGLARDRITTFAVPGALEIPVVAKRLAARKKFSVIVAFGVVLKGETYHFEIVADQCAAGLQQVAVQTGIPVINEVLACYTAAQAEARCGDNDGNKGREAAAAAVAMLNLLPQLSA
ncbi:MAG: 6,7-dimethyl-8-ribityllumazine synthase [bacterium]|nr:6,7-dimethyl-8-ribityllumazine synthase [bacterium]